jgi:hypothetical protein
MPIITSSVHIQAWDRTKYGSTAAEGYSLVNKPSGRELGDETMSKVFLEAPLVVVEPLSSFVVDSTDIDDDVAWVEDRGIAGSLEVYASIASQLGRY